MIRTIIRDISFNKNKITTIQDDYIKRFQYWSVASQFLYLYEEVS